MAPQRYIMQDLRDLLHVDETTLPQERAVALLTLIRVNGDTSHRTANRMLVREDGHWFGGGHSGFLEVPALERIQAILEKGKPGEMSVDTNAEDFHALGLGLGRSGVVDILVQPLQEEDAHHPLRLLRAILAADREPQVLITVTRSAQADLVPGQVFRYKEEAGFRRQFPVSGPAVEELLAKILMHRANYRSKYLRLEPEEGAFEVFIEVFPPRLRLLLFGANHDVQLLLRLAKQLGWWVGIVTDPTPLNQEIYATADGLYPPFGELPPLDDRTAAILIQHDRAADGDQLKRLLVTPIPYIGLLGPNRRQQAILDDLRRELPDLNDRLAGRLHGPIGLDIGATGPGEIALSILAEVRAFFSGQSGGFLRGRAGEVHG